MSCVNNIVTHENCTGDDAGYDVTVVTTDGRFLVFVEVADAEEAAILSQRLSAGSTPSHDWIQIICVPSGTQVSRERTI